MRVISNGCRGLWSIVIAVSVIVAVASTGAQGAAARAAKDVGEQSKALAAAARYLQGPGFTDPMVETDNVDNHLSVEVDVKTWTHMSKAQKYEFIERVNTGALNAGGGIAMDIQVSSSGTKVAASAFTGGQQTMRLLAE